MSLANHSCGDLLCENEAHSCATIRHNLPGDILARIFYFAKKYDFFGDKRIFQSRHIYYLLETDFSPIFVSAVEQSQIQIVREIIPRIDFRYDILYTNVVLKVIQNRNWRLLKTMFNYEPFEKVMTDRNEFIIEVMKFTLNYQCYGTIDDCRKIIECLTHIMPGIFIVDGKTAGDTIYIPRSLLIIEKRLYVKNVLDIVLDAFPGKKVSADVSLLLFQLKLKLLIKRVIAENRIHENSYFEFFHISLCNITSQDEELMMLALKFPTYRRDVLATIKSAKFKGDFIWSDFLTEKILPLYPV